MARETGRPGVFCLGIATLDYVYSVETLPVGGEKYRSRGLAVVGGGCAGNAAVAIARLGGACWLATRLADDPTGDQIVADLEGEGVDAGFVRRVAGLRSPVSAIVVDAEGERMVISYSDPAMPEDTGWLPRALPEGAGAVLADTRWGEGAFAALELARKAGVPGVLDGDRNPPHPGLVGTASHVAFSQQALRELSGEDDPRAGLSRVAAEVPSWLAVTLGREGVLFMEDGAVSHVPAFRVETVDTLGAGDVWHGAFALALAEGQGELAAIRFASATAAIKCTRFGGRAGAPRREEVERLLAEAP
ncbi:PfkB family carbohydrate kinase [Bosea sp. (in: a-proteobacteria)]|uniref:PfkB family carbohydrate kinase n=1 Tax=Bosea sp. (in: a-proteobacteria) TaxID=1871050 RepID=UPI002631FF76|nr:PfkB family carbohydrate kinase [Bosea sp. (in: a-proteobacteria)]MCO5092574.1 PfkB family carbohydrate kinase [Bosea sp. (in: a-proteobacteria)]